MKYINFKRYKFSTVLKNLNTLKYSFLKIFKFKKVNFSKINKYFNPKSYNIPKIRNVYLIKKKFILFDLPVAVVFFGMLYLIIPTFYNYDKTNIEKAICWNNNFECIINGKVAYSFFPTPRMKIKDLVVNIKNDKKNAFMIAENVSIVLSIKNLLSLEKHKFKRIQINNFDTKLDVDKIQEYRNILKKNKFIPIHLNQGQLKFFDKKNYVATISNSKIYIKFIENNREVNLEGNFLGDNIFFSFNKNKKKNDELLSEIKLKMSNMNLLMKISFSEKEKEIINGNFLINKKDNKITGIFDYDNKKIKIKKSNLRNPFMDGKLSGVVSISPYFNFNLDLNLRSIKFTKLYNYFLNLDQKKQKNLFRIHNKINGKLNLSSDRIYSSRNLVKSLESRIIFNNGNILIEQFLINLGKLGAADMLGMVNNEKKLTHLKFESNIFLDSKKKFLSKLGIFNKENFPFNFFVSGNFDLDNLRVSFYEIYENEKLNNEDINFIEKQFNDIMLDEGFKSLFYFAQFKEFVKTLTNEVD